MHLNHLKLFTSAALMAATLSQPALAIDPVSHYQFNNSNACAQLLERTSPSISAEMKDLKEELDKPEQFRTEKDPRFFSSLRNPEKNPVTINLRNKIAELNEILQTPHELNTFSKLWKRYLPILEDLSRNILGRDAKNDIYIGLLNLSNILEVTPEQIIQRFHEIDQLAAKQRTNGVYDPYILSLTQISFEHQVSAEDVVQRFFAIDILGGTTKAKFTIHDSNVVALTEISYLSQTSSENLIKRFFEFEHLGRTTKENFHFNDESITVLTRLSLLKPQLSVEQINSTFFEIYELGKNTVSDFYLNDLSAAILTDAVFSLNQSATDIIARFFEVRSALKEKKLGNYVDEFLARLTYMSLQFSVSAENFVVLLKRAKDLAPQDTSIGTITNVVAMMLVKEDRGSDVSDTDLINALKIPELTLSSVTNQLYDSETQKANRTINVDVTYSGGSGGSSRKSNVGGVGFVLTSDGLKLGIGLGGNIGMDFGGHIGIKL